MFGRDLIVIAGRPYAQRAAIERLVFNRKLGYCPSELHSTDKLLPDSLDGLGAEFSKADRAGIGEKVDAAKPQNIELRARSPR